MCCAALAHVALGEGRCPSATIGRSDQWRNHGRPPRYFETKEIRCEDTEMKITTPKGQNARQTGPFVMVPKRKGQPLSKEERERLNKERVERNGRLLRDIDLGKL